MLIAPPEHFLDLFGLGTLVSLSGSESDSNTAFCFVPSSVINRGVYAHARTAKIVGVAQ